MNLEPSLQHRFGPEFAACSTAKWPYVFFVSSALKRIRTDEVGFDQVIVSHRRSYVGYPFVSRNRVDKPSGTAIGPSHDYARAINGGRIGTIAATGHSPD